MATLNPDFAFVRNGYHIRLANGAPHIQTQIGRLIGDLYGSRGLQAYTTVCTVGGPEQITLAACSGDRVFGTLTLGVDTGSGLLADTLYRDEINRVRAGGGRVGEVTRLALDPELSTQDVMAHIFNITFLLARQIHRVTDLFVEVHPRHAGFYQRMMGYRVAGPVRTCPRVNAPAVLLHLCLHYVEGQIDRLAGLDHPSERSLYKRFLPLPEQNTVLQQMVAGVALAA